jgi:translation elongation factor EF-4
MAAIRGHGRSWIWVDLAINTVQALKKKTTRKEKLKRREIERERGLNSDSSRTMQQNAIT